MDGRNAALLKHVHHHRIVGQLSQCAAGNAGIGDLQRLLHRAADAHAEACVGSDLNRHAFSNLSERISSQNALFDNNSMPFPGFLLDFQKNLKFS
jgi:hypothetical protein